MCTGHSSPTSTALPVALVTGASSGLGWLFAERLAAAGYDVVLSARRVDRLEELAAQITKRFHVRAYPIACDLGAVDGASMLVKEIHARGLHVSYLVNNAGVTVEGDFLDHSWDEQRACTQLMALTPAELIHLLLPDMIERGEGRVLNVGSVGAYWPSFPGMTLYGPSKSYLLKLTRTLALEYRDSGVRFSVVCPFLTQTAFLDGPITRQIVAQVPRGIIADPADVVDQALSAVKAGRVVQHTSLLNRVLVLALTLVPPALIDRVILRFMSLADKPTKPNLPTRREVSR